MTSFIPTKYPFGGFQAKIEKAEYFVFGAPLDETGSYRNGYKDAPRAIRKANANIETLNIFNHQDIAELLIYDAGDLNWEKENIKSKINTISKTTNNILRKNMYPIIIGGEHSILAANSKALPPKSTLVVLDAHADLRNEYEGNAYSHACAVKRAIMNNEFEKIIIFGLRAISIEEKKSIEALNTTIFWAKDILKQSISEIRDLGIKIAEESNAIFVSIDLDVFDPSVAPGVGNPEPMGLIPQQVFFFLNELAGKTIGMEISEYIPKYDVSEITSFLAARAIHTIITSHYFLTHSA